MRIEAHYKDLTNIGYKFVLYISSQKTYMKGTVAHVAIW